MKTLDRTLSSAIRKKKSGENSRQNKNVDPIEGKLFITSLLKCDSLGEGNAFIEVVSYSNFA